MLQRLLIALAQVKQVIHLKTYKMKSGKLHIFCIEQKQNTKIVNKNITNSIKL